VDKARKLIRRLAERKQISGKKAVRRLTRKKKLP
jgi:hypothetical protein